MPRLFILPAFILSVIFQGKALPPVSGNNWNMVALNTAAKVTYLTDNEKNVILEINKLRSDPSSYAHEYLEPLLTLYKGNKLCLPGDTPINTKEGIVALRDAIQYLRKSAPVLPLMPDVRLTRASRDHQKDQTFTGNTGHVGGDGSDVQKRIHRYGTISKAVGENIFYGDPDARSVVLHLVIDDGVASRGHRKNLLNENFRLIGVAMGKHPVWRNVCVMDFAYGFSNEPVSAKTE